MYERTEQFEECSTPMLVELYNCLFYLKLIKSQL